MLIGLYSESCNGVWCLLTVVTRALSPSYIMQSQWNCRKQLRLSWDELSVCKEIMYGGNKISQLFNVYVSVFSFTSLYLHSVT